MHGTPAVFGTPRQLIHLFSSLQTVWGSEHHRLSSQSAISVPSDNPAICCWSGGRLPRTPHSRPLACPLGAKKSPMGARKSRCKTRRQALAAPSSADAMLSPASTEETHEPHQEGRGPRLSVRRDESGIEGRGWGGRVRLLEGGEDAGDQVRRDDPDRQRVARRIRHALGGLVGGARVRRSCWRRTCSGARPSSASSSTTI